MHNIAVAYSMFDGTTCHVLPLRALTARQGEACKLPRNSTQNVSAIWLLVTPYKTKGKITTEYSTVGVDAVNASLCKSLVQVVNRVYAS